tara:strand:+ start:601 stop:1080 length:480 start_codon:yes stop_codon:yes gene_type:complete
VEISLSELVWQYRYQFYHLGDIYKLFGLFNKSYNDWYSYLTEKEFPGFGYGETVGYSGLEYVKVVHNNHNINLNSSNCNAEIPTGIKCKIINSALMPGNKLIELECPKCKKLIEFDAFQVASTEMVERENKKKGAQTKKATVPAVDSGVYSKVIDFNQY